MTHRIDIFYQITLYSSFCCLKISTKLSFIVFNKEMSLFNDFVPISSCVSKDDLTMVYFVSSM